ncbi:MAG: ATP-binding protein [Patescibacteria group bacterium]
MKTHIHRTIEPRIEAGLFKGKIIVIYGARQVGKTTLLKELEDKRRDETLYLNCDEPDTREKLANQTSTALRELFRNRRLILIDEAQRVRNIGLTLKLIADNVPGVQVVATGSSSFALSNDVSEPLTGRKMEMRLHPFTLAELATVLSREELERRMEQFLTTGLYPEAFFADTLGAPQVITELAEGYLYKDALEYQQIKKPDALRKLLQALALQIGSEVSYTELGALLGIDKATLERYVDLLEKAFVIFKLPPLSRNLRKEIGKMRKIYFYDVGIRNSLIRNFNGPGLRTDIGALWENFLIAERMKHYEHTGALVNTFFWRTYDQQEVDFVEEAGGTLRGFEIKWKKGAHKLPRLFTDTYPQSTVQVITRETALAFASAGELK